MCAGRPFDGPDRGTFGPPLQRLSDAGFLGAAERYGEVWICMKKRWLGLFLLAMVSCTLLPVTALAAGTAVR